MKKKLAVFALLICLLTLGLSVPAMAANKGSGKLGNLSWTVSSKNVLTISGKGEMSTPALSDVYPWNEYAGTIKKIVINAGVTSISQGAFFFTTSSTLYSQVTEISLPTTIKTIGDYAFAGCRSLKSVTIPSGVEAIGTMAFADLSLVTSLTLPSSLKTIGMLAFYGLGIQKLTLPANLQTLGEGAFFQCSSLTSVTIPAKLKSFGNGAFASCAGLTEYKVHSDNKYFSASNGVLMNKARTKLLAYPNGKKATTYTIGSKVTTVEKLAFSGAVNLTAITVPAKVKTIDANSMANCSALASITVNSENSYFTSVSGVLFNKEKTTLITYPCAKEGSYYAVPSTVTKVGDYAFFGNLYLTDLCINEGVTEIGAEAFDTNEIRNFYLPSTLKKIGENAFLNCNAVKSINYPGSRVKWAMIDIVTSDNADSNDFSRYHMVYNYKDKTPGTATVKLSNVSSTGYVKLSWKAVSGACSYIIYRSTGKTGTYTRIGTTSELSYLCKTGAVGKTYYYKVKAVSLTGLLSKYSSAVSGFRVCARPVVTVTRNSKEKPVIKWKSITGASKYTVYRSTSKTGTFTKLTTTTKLTYTDTSAKSGKTYYYKVKVIAKSGTAADSAFSSVKKIKL